MSPATVSLERHSGASEETLAHEPTMASTELIRQRAEQSEREAKLWQPELLDAADEQTSARVLALVESGVAVHDRLLAQLGELLDGREARYDLSLDAMQQRAREHLGDRPLERYGTWVHYPWSRRLVHLLPRAEFREARTSRNRYKISPADQARLEHATIAIIGLSVGLSAAVTLALEGVGGRFHLADFDWLSVTNLNRLRTGVHHLGVPKTVIAAREMLELDPYLEIVPFHEGATEENLGRLLDGVDLVVEECDSLFMKVLVRERARALGIPVVMDTSDRGQIDVERFDRERDRPIFHGLLGPIEAQQLKGLSTKEKVPHVLRIIGEDTISAELAGSMVEIEETISTWPQLGSDVTYGGALTTNVVRRILLDQLRTSGRYFVDLDEIVADGTSHPLEPWVAPAPADDEELRAGPQLPAIVAARGATPTAEEWRTLAAWAVTAPSGGNAQPWCLVVQDGALHVSVDRPRIPALLDFDASGACLAIGALVENLSEAAAAMGFAIEVTTLPDPSDRERICRVGLRRDSGLAPTLLPWIGQRHTNRVLGERVPLTAEQQARLRGAATHHGAELELLTEAEQIRPLIEIVAEGDRARFFSPKLHHEMMSELRFTRRSALDSRDGIDLDTLELSATDRAAFQIVRRGDVMGFVAAIDGGRALGNASRKALAAASAACLVRAPGHGRAGYFLAGRAMQRIWLTATSLGLRLQPMSALFYLVARLEAEGDEAFEPRVRGMLGALRVQLRALFPAREGFVDGMLFRLAHAGPPSARALRRRLDDVLRFA